MPLVRPHSECLTGDVFGSQRCDCGAQLREAVERIADSGGYLLYLRQEGRGIGLYAKLDAYALQDAGLDTYEANLALGHREDERSYLVAAQMLHALGVSRVALLSNNPDKARQLRRFGVTVTARVPTGVHLSATNARYLATKARRGAHTLDVPLSAGMLDDRSRQGRTSRSAWSTVTVELPGSRLRQAPARIAVGLGGQLGLLLARGTHPPGEPLRGQVGLRGAESPRAGPDEDLGAEPAELLDGERDGVRAEQAAALGRAALVGIERGGHAAVQRVRRGQLDATDDGQGQQHRASRAGTDGDQPGQLVLGQHVQQRRGGDQGRAGEIARAAAG